MQRKLDFKIDPQAAKIKHGDNIIMLGSCFADEIGAQFAENGFRVLSNPFGTLFHPVPIARLIRETILGNIEERIIQREDIFLSWDAAGEIYGLRESEVRKTLAERREQLRIALKQGNYLFITLGSSFAYRNQQTGEIVANCHKMPQRLFDKELTSAATMQTMWIETLQSLKEFNPELQVVFTVSPVRHFKDGLIANNRSKSRLFELIGELEATSSAHYFPAYEIVMDELRDYRFYNADGIHPNELAVRYVWERFEKVFFSAQTQELCQEMRNLRSAFHHRMLQPDAKAAHAFDEARTRKLKAFLAVHPEVCW